MSTIDYYSQCTGCGKTFYFHNHKHVIGSPEYNTICHKECCGTSELCKGCSIFQRMEFKMQSLAMKHFLNILIPCIQAFEKEQLESSQGVELNLSPIIAAELDRRSGNITSYDVNVDNEGNVVMRIEK